MIRDMKYYDKVIIGAGLYGLYSALQCGKNGQTVLVLERDDAPFSRATYINQARVHMGYHYPRSYSTAVRSCHYFERFCQDFGFCIHRDFDQIYATSRTFSWTDAKEFRQFCQNVGIQCRPVSAEDYFNPGMVDGAFLTREYTYDAQILKRWFLDQLSSLNNVRLCFHSRPEKIIRQGNSWIVRCEGMSVETPFILNAAYAGVNDVLKTVEGEAFEPFRIKYEKCEIILCRVSENLRNTGITVMDGPFFSLMPFGLTGYHSLTSVTFTPHETSYDVLPTFSCQKQTEGRCSFENGLDNCNSCRFHPKSAWVYMSHLAEKYLKEEYQFSYVQSLYSMKPILTVSEMDDSRPTIIRVHSESPGFVSVLSGKINTVYDLDEVLHG